MTEQRGAALMKDQMPVFDRCLALLGEGGKEDWKVLPSTYQEVKMEMRYFPPKRGERSIGAAKAVGVIDCSAEEVAAWLMDYCSNERMRIHREEGSPARLELKNKTRENESTVASIKKFPIFLRNREIVFREIWKSEEGKILIGENVRRAKRQAEKARLSDINIRLQSICA